MIRLEAFSLKLKKALLQDGSNPLSRAEPSKALLEAREDNGFLSFMKEKKEI